jgi:hypothetical protein
LLLGFFPQFFVVYCVWPSNADDVSQAFIYKDLEGHTLQKKDKIVTKQALDWNPQGQRKRGRPKNTWRRGLNTELQKIGMTWNEWNETKTMAKDRRGWKANVIALCPPMDEVD